MPAPLPRVVAAAASGALLLAVPDVLRQVAVWDDPSPWHALLVDVVGFASACVLPLCAVRLRPCCAACWSPEPPPLC